MLLANAINEACEAVDDWEFHARLGASRIEARALQRRLKDIIANMDRLQ